MDSIFGKTIAFLIALLALAAVVALGYGAVTKSNDADMTSAVFALAQNIKGDYANNPAGYGTLTNGTVIAAGEAPPSIVKNGALVDPWGNAMSVSAISGNAHAFQVSFGPVPASSCTRIASDMTSADGIQIGSGASPMTPPFDAGSLASACAKSNGGPITLMYGGVKPLSYIAGTLLYSNNGPTGSGFGDGVFYNYVSPLPAYLANQWKINNANKTQALVTVFLWDYPVNDTPPATILVNGAQVTPTASGFGGSFSGYGERYYQFYVQPGENIISAVQNTVGGGIQATSGYVWATSGISASQYVATGTASQPY